MWKQAVACLTVLCVAVPLFALPAPYASDVRPAVKPYDIPANLAQVRHVEKAKDLRPSQREALAKRGFVVIPDRVEQMFFLYESYGDDYEKGPIPNFITVDSVLQAYHIFFDFALRSVETEHLIRLAVALTDAGAGVGVRYVREAPEGALRDAARRNLAYWLVARRLLTGKEPTISADLPDKAAICDLAKEELAKIAEHAGRLPSTLMGSTVHYDQFLPRGHYTRTTELKRYFMAMMWFGTLGFLLDGGEHPELVERHCLQALLLTKFLAEDDWRASLWERIYEPTSFFVGTADDLTWKDYLPIARGVFGQELSLGKLADAALLEQFIGQARRKLPSPRIAPAFLQADAAGNLERVPALPQGRQFRFMGQRFIPDSYAMQQLVYPLVGVGKDGEPRYWPMGLDVMAVLGSARARELLFNFYHQDQYENYATQLARVTKEFGGIPEERWWQNLYWGWLNSLRPLLKEKGDGYPTFMRGAPWLDKELVTAQASWAQLRHDTILYGKPSGAEMGDGGYRAVEGYVEPYPEVFGRLAYLAHISKAGLKERGLLSKRLANSFSDFGSMLLFLKECAEKQLANRALDRKAYERLQYFGGELERLTLSVVEGGDKLRYWYEITNEADRHMATIADVHSSFQHCLEVGVGNAYRIYVVVPHPAGGLQLTKGGVMSYHEFHWPVSDRLTDEKWIAMLKAGEAPPMPEWTETFVVP